MLGALGTTAVLLQLFLGTDVGLADNGDGFRLMCTFHLTKRVDVLANPLELHYVSVPVGCAPALNYFSSMQWLVAPGRALYRLRYGAEAGLDLRVLGVVGAVVQGAALAGLYLGLPGGRLRRGVTVGLAALLLADISFATYFVSPFSEPAAFLGLLVVTACVAWYLRAPRRPVVPLVALTAAGVFLCLAKSQTAPFAALLLPVLLLRAVPLGRRAGPWAGRVAPALAALVLVGVTATNLAQTPAFFSEVNVHNLVFRTLLPDDADPAGALRALGAPASLLRYEGTGYFDPPAAGKATDPDYAVFQNRVTRGVVLRFIAEHPGHWLPLLRAGARAAPVLRVDYLSNFPTPRSPQDFLAPRPDPARRLLALLGPASWPLLPLAWLVTALVSAVVALRRSSPPGRRATAAASYLLAAGALSQVLVALLGDGYYELVKHTILAGYATVLLGCLGAGWAVSRLAAAARTPHTAPAAPPSPSAPRRRGSKPGDPMSSPPPVAREAQPAPSRWQAVLEGRGLRWPDWWRPARWW